MPPPGDHVDSSGDEDLTPPPHSPDEPTSPSAQVAHDFATHHQNSISVVAPNPTIQLGPPQVPEKIRKKPGRKPGWNKPKDAEALAAAAAAAEASNTDGPRKRAARKPKDPNAPIVPRARKKKGESLDVPAAQAVAAQSRADLQPRPSAEFTFPPPKSETGQNEGIHRPIQSFFAPAPPPPAQQQPQTQQQQTQQQQAQQAPPQQVRSSGQNYDPIRSNYDPVRETIVSHSNPFSTQGSPNPVPIMNRASASPSISSLVDPPNHALASPSIATQSFFNQQARHRDDSHHSLPASPQSNRLPGPEIVSAPPPPPKVPASNGELPSTTLEASAPLTVPAPVTSKKGSGPASTATSSAVSPKVKPKDKDTSIYPAPPPLPGSGIMQGNNPEYRAPTVILTVPMNGEINKYVNFSRLAEERYGWDALHPRLAAQRERLARVAAAGAALERNGDSKDSGDDMSLDSDAEAENSNIEMGGMSDGRTGTDAGGKKVPKKRKLKEDEYDKDDGFVDDSDLLWEEQAAAANDGFFVYSGPLVPESEKPANDSRGDGAPKRGRGGRARGGSKLGSSTRGAAAPKPSRDGLPASGPGSRGGSINRKPRITKADRARMEQEKEERERMGAASMSMPTNGYGGMIPLGSSLGTTPMVFNQN